MSFGHNYQPGAYRGGGHWGHPVRKSQTHTKKNLIRNFFQNFMIIFGGYYLLILTTLLLPTLYTNLD